MRNIKYCSLNKEQTARITLWKELRIPYVYTYETSFYGGEEHYSTKDYHSQGVEFCKSLFQILHDELGDDSSVFRQKNLLKQQLENNLKMNIVNLDEEEKESNGSDSSPSEDELSDDVRIKLKGNR